MGLFEKFMASKEDKDSGLELEKLRGEEGGQQGSDGYPDMKTEQQPPQRFDQEPTQSSFEGTTVNADPGFAGSNQSQTQQSDQKVELILERLDTIKSQLSHIQSRLDSLENGKRRY